MTEFISIKEIALITGKTETSIRKKIREIIKRNPSVTGSVTKGNLSVTSNGNGNVTSTELIIKEKTPKGFTYKVDKEFILKELSVTERVTGSVTPSVTGNVTSNIEKEPQITEVEFLRQELQQRNEQINLLIAAQEKKDSLIEKLRDRVLLLEAPKPEPISDPVMVQKIPEPAKQNFIQKLFTWFKKN